MLATTVASYTPLELIVEHLKMLVYLASMWLPFVFLAYGIGRRQFGMRAWFAFVTVETIAVGLTVYLGQLWYVF